MISSNFSLMTRSASERVLLGTAQGIHLNVDVLADRQVVLVLQMGAAAHALKRQVDHGVGPGNARECSEDNCEVVRFKAHSLTDMAAVQVTGPTGFSDGLPL